MREKLPSIRVNMVMNAVLTMASVAFPIISLPFVTRALGPDGTGRVYFASSVITFFSLFAEIGIPVYGIRACARVRNDREELSRTAQEILIINLITCIIVYAALFASVAFIPRLAGDRDLMVLMSLVIGLNAIGAEWLYKAIESYTYITVRSVNFKLIALIGMILLVRTPDDYMLYGGLTIFAACASSIINLVNLRKHITLRPLGSYRLRRHLPAMLMLGVLAAATTIYTSLDIALLDILRGDAQAGMYGVAVKIKLALVSLVTSVSAVLLPRISAYYDEGKGKAAELLLSKTMGAVLAISIPTACYFMIFAGECIGFLAGDEFSGAISALIILMPALIVISVSNLIGMQIMIPSGREREVTISAVGGAVIDVVLNLILIPPLGPAGAALSTLIAEILIAAYMIRCIGREETGKLLGDTHLMRIICMTLAAAAAGAWVKAIPVGDFARLIISAFCYFGAYAVMLLTVRLKASHTRDA